MYNISISGNLSHARKAIMSQHFLLSAKAITLSVRQITKLSEQEAHDLLKTIRWGECDKDIVCPHCGTIHALYKIKTRNQYPCKYCQHTFSVTSVSSSLTINYPSTFTCWRLCCSLMRLEAFQRCKWQGI